VEDVLAKTGCTVISKVAVLLEEGGYSGEDLIYLQKLPVFPV
jgi:adenine phosphoribosyltransferase